ncbi:MAG: CinA family protein, partial [Clostridiales bacterium]|nr:CinA family protein [Clostridiales bacterium]
AALNAAGEAARGKLSLHARDSYGETRIELIYDSETPKMVCDETLRILASELEDYVYAIEDIPIARRLFDLLKLRRMKLSTAESFTAGKVGQAIVNIPGASAVFYEGLNTYDSASKRDRLGVSEFTLKTKGAVSSEVAYEMAAGLIADGKCDLAIATTGIAGPQSDGTEKPVGLCYIAVGTKEQVRVFRYRLSGDRDTITNTAVNLALFLAYREIK